MLGAQFPEILAAARTGAEWAWSRIYLDLAPLVLGYLRARRAREPEDLTGEVFLQVVRDLPRFEGGEHDFRAWVFVIARNRLVDESRRHARRPVELAPEAPVDRRAPEDVETQVLHEAATERVRRIIEQLAPDQRDVLLLRVLGELTVEEVARVIGRSPGAVKALQRRGLAAIKRTLAREGVTL
ncbi:MAG: sigma-70 family RNA polymerase sigma factor [Thermoleophilia bacterium]|nr:sigma-70 family RNA polymerase sigma factor [Thermoleophilia bacterium]